MSSKSLLQFDGSPLTVPALPWRPPVRARYAAPAVRSSNAFYSQGRPFRMGQLHVDWHPRNAFSTAQARFALATNHGVLHGFVAPQARFEEHSFCMEDLEADLPQTLKVAALHELLEEPLRQFASLLGLAWESLEIDAGPLSVPENATERWAFFHLDLPALGISLRGAVQCGPEVVEAVMEAAKRRPSRRARPWLMWPMAVSLRTPPLHLSQAQARCVTPGCGLSLGPISSRGLPLGWYLGHPSRCIAVGHYQGTQMTVDQTYHDPAATLMPDPDHPHGSTTQSGLRLDEVGVRVSIEFASLRRTLGDLSGLRPGYVMPMNQPLDSAEVRLVVEGQAVGRGCIVALDDQLAVEVTEWTLGH